MIIMKKRQDSYWINLTAIYMCVCVCAGVCAHSTTDKTVSTEVFFCDMEVSLSLRLRLHSQNQA